MKKYVDEEKLNLSLTESKNYTDTETEKLQTSLDTFKTETWTFTLNDGSTTTKQVVVK